MKVMVVDDEIDIAKLTSIIFDLHGFETIKATSGEECLKKLNEGIVPDVIVLDVMMPGIGGFETCRKIKSDERFRRIPIVILSARVHAKDINEGMAAGADDYLTKPFNPQELVDLIKMHAKK
jgi:DNA-binding response OmpR family regulator